LRYITIPIWFQIGLILSYSLYLLLKSHDEESFCLNLINPLSEINLVEQKCSKCGLLDVLVDNMCRYCNPQTIRRAYLVKQTEVKNYLDDNEIHYQSYDATINNGTCGKERPDFVFLSDNKCYYVVLEVDEDQHKDRVCDCEYTRMINISQALGSPTVFIRYNPDKYVTNRDTHNYFATKRLPILKNWLMNYLSKSLEEIRHFGYCSVTYLFYDKYEEGKVQSVNLLPFEYKTIKISRKFKPIIKIAKN